MDSVPMFNSVEDECRYWKERAKLYHREWTDVKQEYDEYVEQSRQMEAEMDATLDQKQIIIKDLRMKLTYSEKENESLKLKRDSDGIEFTNLTKQLEKVRNERDSMKEYLRQLEQKNDDLERAHRILNESIVDFERMLDKAYEKNALLEMEVDEKEVLQEKLQRLMDETRDLKQELNVKTRYVPNGSTSKPLKPAAALTNGINGTNGIATHEHNGEVFFNSLQNGVSESDNTITTATNRNDYNHHSLKNSDHHLLNGNGMQASSRTAALNIVADMLRKLNLDKALICPHCDKFRCICARPDSEQKHCNGANNSVGSNSSSTPAKEEPARRSSTSTTAPNTLCHPSGSGSGSSKHLYVGTNMFKRFALRMGGNVDLCAPTTSAPTSTVVTDIP